MSVRWSYAAAAGVDAGARCTFSAQGSATTSLSCTDDGTFTVTVTVGDGLHAPVAASAQVVIPNRPPTLSLTSAPAPWSVHEPGAAVSFVATATDPEANDTVTCTIAWDDGATEQRAPTAGVCSFRHRYSSPGMYTVRVSAEDDDGGRSEEERLIVVSSPAHGSASGLGELRDLAAGGASEYQRGHLEFTATNLGLCLGPRGHIGLTLETGAERHALPTGRPYDPPMPHLTFDLNVSPPDDARARFGEAVARRFGEIMDTGTDHVAVLVRAHSRGSLTLGLAKDPARGIALASADLRLGRTKDQERRLCLAFLDELERWFGIPRDQVYVVLTRHDGPEFQLADRVLPSWSPGEDPLAS